MSRAGRMPAMQPSPPPAPEAAPAPKRASDSCITMSQLMLPEDANPWGNVHGGSIMKLVDSAAGVVATRHCRTRVVTARIDSMSFLRPVFIGNVVTLKASVNDTGHTSLEIGVRVEAENLTSGETWHVGSAYLVYVSLDEGGSPAPVPGIAPETPDEVRRQRQAHERRDRRHQDS